MAKVTVRIVGGGVKEMSGSTVGDIKRALGLDNYGAVVNGQPAKNETALRDNDSISLATNSKGGAR